MKEVNKQMPPTLLRPVAVTTAPQRTDFALTLHRLDGASRQSGVAIFEAMMEMEAYGAALGYGIIVIGKLIMGEPLKGNFRGYSSAPVKKNFLIIYRYCKACRLKKIALIK
jgi:hypothetical protein